MSKRCLVLVFAIFLFCILKHLDVEVSQSHAVAKADSTSLVATKKSETKSLVTPARLISSEDTKAVAANSTLIQSALRRAKSKQEIFCRLKSAGVDLSYTDLKLTFIDRGYPPQGQALLVVYVQTPDCPPDLFSKYEIDSDNRLINSFSCHDVSRKELYLGSGLQSSVVYVGPRKNKVDAAISGRGMFVVRCADEFRYTRVGNWDYAADGTLLTKDRQCEVLDRQGRAMILGSESDLDDSGCNAIGQCLAVASPETEEAFEIIDRKTLLAVEDPLKYLVPEAYDTRIFTDSLENTKEAESGIFGPNFEELPYMDKPAFCPETF